MKTYSKIYIVFFYFVLFIGISTFSFFSFTYHIDNYKVRDVMEIDDDNYSKTLEVALESHLFLKEYENDYTRIHFQEEKDFINHVNTLLQLQYSADDINHIYAFLSESNLLKLLTIDKVDLHPFYQIKNFEVDKIPRYETYQNLHHCSLDEAVLKVNIGLDHDFYTQIEEITNQSDYTVLVNKYHSLGNYEPNDLESLSYDAKYKLRKDARDAFEKLVSAAKLEGVFIRPYSAYRSYDYQTLIYNNYVERDGVLEADTYSARPGHSEHQTGLAVDVWSVGSQEISESDALWLVENAYKFGFIVRYTDENMPITGYIAEPWHLRYLGVTLATDVVSKNLTYDEYYDLYIK